MLGLFSALAIPAAKELEKIGPKNIGTIITSALTGEAHDVLELSTRHGMERPGEGLINQAKEFIHLLYQKMVSFFHHDLTKGFGQFEKLEVQNGALVAENAIGQVEFRKGKDNKIIAEVLNLSEQKAKAEYLKLKRALNNAKGQQSKIDTAVKAVDLKKLDDQSIINLAVANAKGKAYEVHELPDQIKHHIENDEAFAFLRPTKA